MIVGNDAFESKWGSIDNVHPTIMAGGANKQGGFVETSLGDYAIGKEWDKLKPGEQSDKNISLQRAHPELQDTAILASHGGSSIGSVTHPTERRKFTIAELKRICAFPDDFQLVGSYAQQWERLGRAVPPVMMAHIARCVEEVLRSAAG